MLTLRKAVIVIASAAFLAFLGWYVVHTTSLYAHGPRLTLISPEENKTFSEPVVTVRGYARNVSTVYINNRAVFISPEGLFEEDIVLYPGYTVVDIRAKDRFGRETRELRYLSLAQSANHTINLNPPVYGQEEDISEEDRFSEGTEG